MRDHRRNVHEIFEHALALPPSKRAEFLAERCRGDTALRKEIEDLLRRDAVVETDFLAPPAPLAAESDTAEQPEPSDHLIGTEIGHYHITARVGIGGMGTVYEAEDLQLRRRVAIKVLGRRLLSPSAVRRFAHESRILAHLNHPNVARIYEAGMHAAFSEVAGVEAPYFAMEFITDAMPITHFAVHRSLSVTQRIETFIKVCNAVHHGHQKGVIHRDLKPGNILVDPIGEPKVIDFGIARATDGDVAVTTMLTDVGRLVGTLQYMSPEQCDGDPNAIDLRSDIYALGLLLYELLCEQLPYDVSGLTISGAARMIREHTPVRPGEIHRSLRGDLDVIVRKTLEKDREKRYASADALAEDLRRWLNREPINARPPTAWSRAVRWTLRHPIATTLALCASILAGTLGATWASVWFFYNRPHRLIISGDQKSVMLVARSENVIFEWNSEKRILGAHLVRPPDDPENRCFAIIGFEQRHVESACAATICAFDATNPDGPPVWRGRIEQDDLPPTLLARGILGEEFSANIGIGLLDIFSENPGKELVGLHSHAPYSESCIRVYSLSGRILYQVWFDGSLHSDYGAHWLSDRNLLVLAGINSEAYWEDRGVKGLNDAHPRVVFAIRPVYGFVSRGQLRDDRKSGPLGLEWRFTLYPFEMANGFYVARVNEPGVGVDPNRHFKLEIRQKESDAGFTWTLDKDGRILPGEPIMNDPWKRSHTLPDPSTFSLGPLPPIINRPQPDSALDTP